MKSKLIFSILFNVIFVFQIFGQSTVLINGEDWTSSSPNGACACDTDFNNGSVINFLDASSAVGYSSNEAEEITKDWAAAGANVLLHAVLETAEIID